MEELCDVCGGPVGRFIGKDAKPYFRHFGMTPEQEAFHEDDAERIS